MSALAIAWVLGGAATLLLLIALAVVVYRKIARDFFASVALHAMIAEPEPQRGASTAAGVLRDATPTSVTDRLALAAYMVADAMLSARRDPGVPLLNSWPKDKP